MSGPDMTPQGVSDAIDRLVADLPKRKREVSDSWQKVLALQVLSTVLGDQWSDPTVSTELRSRCLDAALAVSRAVEALLREKPALRQALLTAYALGAEDVHEPTPFSDSTLGQLVLVAADSVREDMEKTGGAA